MLRILAISTLLIGFLVLAGAANLQAAETATAKIVGSWQATLQAGNQKLHLVVHITKNADGTLNGSLDSLDQNDVGLPIDTITFADDTLNFTIGAIGGHFIGSLAADGKTLEGQWMQNGGILPMSCQRADDAARAQDPKKPYPYNEEEVSFQNEPAKITRAGTLTWPRGAGPFPVVLLIGGGQRDRNATDFGHHPFLVLADYLTRQGIAVLRTDDRGVGGSTGDGKATPEDVAGDVLAGVAFLHTRKEFNPKQLGVIARDAGCQTAAMAATSSTDISFLILLAGNGVPGDEVIMLKQDLAAKTAGAQQEQIDQQHELLKSAFTIVKTVKDTVEMEKQLHDLIAGVIAKLPEATRKAIGDPEPIIKAQTAAFLMPEVRFFVSYDPRPTLAKVTVPVLALHGEKDFELDAKQNLPVIEKALKDAGNKDVTALELPRLNHLFQSCKTGQPVEYNQLDETFSPTALQIIGNWIGEHTGKAAK